MTETTKVQWVIGARFAERAINNLDLFLDVLESRTNTTSVIIQDTSVKSAEAGFDLLDTKVPTIVLGTIQMINMFKQYQYKTQKMFIPGYWAFDNVDMNHLIGDTNSQWLINEDDFQFLPYGRAKQYRSFKFDGARYPYFIRPNSSKKTFAGQVIKNESDEIDFFKTTSIPNSELVLVAKHKKIFREARCIIANRELISINLYHNPFNEDDFINHDEYIVSDATHLKVLWNFVQKLLSTKITRLYIPDDVFVMDVGSFYDHKFKIDIDGIIEYNSFNSSGLYIENLADMRNMIEHVERVAIRHYNEIWSDYDGS